MVQGYLCYEMNCDIRRGMRGSHKVRMGIGCRPSPCRDCVGGLYKVRDPNEPEWFKLVRVLMTRARAGKSPFEALAHGGCEISHPQRR